MILQLITILVLNLFANPFSVEIETIRPTQFSIGKKEALKKIKKIEKLYAKGKLSKYLEKKTAPAIKGPENHLWIIDRHHTSYAILNSDIPSAYKRIQVRVIHDWSNLERKEFQAKMIKNNFVYLKDTDFRPIAFNKLPRHIADLVDNPLRSIASRALDEKCYKKTDTPYQQFYWAEHFYNMGTPNKLVELSEVLPLCHIREARELPGFIK
ncbi:ParB/Srx family N-terminal domain-containing protein [Halobacteriovorax sp. HLS]|uniref:ParB/Srx family N-terminal domain-containing protein n=1 Tax=Halobacteriovorax sp. HLS TaxID=2234000 RepID=UPI000FDBB4D0|nr:ParB/Srx family N-terminal domain-containing protein [Halobacteriovorax sp. HLS]